MEEVARTVQEWAAVKRIVLQSQAIHPDWTPKDHAEFLYWEGFEGIEEGAVQAWMELNVSSGAVAVVRAQAGVHGEDLK